MNSTRLKTITELRGTEDASAPYHEPRGVLQAVHDEPQPGFFRRVTLGHGGLVVKRTVLDKHKKPIEVGIAIPLEAILKLAELHEPLLVPNREVEPKE